MPPLPVTGDDSHQCSGHRTSAPIAGEVSRNCRRHGLVRWMLSTAVLAYRSVLSCPFRVARARKQQIYTEDATANGVIEATHADTGSTRLDMTLEVWSKSRLPSVVRQLAQSCSALGVQRAGCVKPPQLGVGGPARRLGFMGRPYSAAWADTVAHAFDSTAATFLCATLHRHSDRLVGFSFSVARHYQGCWRIVIAACNLHEGYLRPMSTV